MSELVSGPLRVFYPLSEDARVCAARFMEALPDHGWIFLGRDKSWDAFVFIRPAAAAPNEPS